MALVDRKIDPTTGDYVAASGGGFATASPVENQIAFSLLLELASWEGDPALGSRLHELARGKMTPDLEQRVDAMLREALQWMLDGNLLLRVDTLVERDEENQRVKFQVTAWEPGKDQPVTVGPLFVRVGA